VIIDRNPWTDCLKDILYDSARDIRMNLVSVMGRNSLEPVDAHAVALAAACATANHRLIYLISDYLRLEPEAGAAMTAAALMAMNNTFHAYVAMAGDEELSALKPDLRMNALMSRGGVSRTKFEMYALSASIVNGSEPDIRAYYQSLKGNLTVTQLRDIGRIASVVAAAAKSVLLE
jgi:lipoyl-dependent peroxiredoxin subunit D